MTNEELNTALYKKMYAEQEEFKEMLLTFSPGEVMQYSYELVIREDILLSMEENDLSNRQAKALLKSKHPLNDLFLKWENQESKHMEEIRDMIERHADECIEKIKARADRGAR